VRHQVGGFGIGLLKIKLHRRGKVTQQQGDRRGRDVLEDEALAGFGERKLRLT
jgi:hypothetical protein